MSERLSSVIKHLIIVIAIIMGVSVVYIRVVGTYFCSYDDFIHLHQAAFQYVREPSRVITTSHINSYLYRPLSQAVNLATYLVGHGSPVLFRMRNLSFHLINIILVYMLGWLLFSSMRVGGVAAALFGLHALANQSIIGAVWTNTIAHMGFLLSLVMFIVSVRTGRFWWLWLIGSLISGWLSLLTYDSEIVVFGLMCIYLFAQFFFRRERFIGWWFVGVFAIVSITLLGSYFLLRILFVSHDWERAAASLSPLRIIAENVSMYGLALLSPVDAVLLNEWLGMPLPSEIVLKRSTIMVLSSVALTSALAFALIIWHWIRRTFSAIYRLNWVAVVFLMSGIAMPLLPVLLLKAHPSETYLYLPVAFYSLLLSYGLAQLLPDILGLKGYGLCIPGVLLLIGLFSAATWIRNERVVRCGETVHRILSGLPEKLKIDSVRTVSFANAPGHNPTRRYGFYGFRGIDTIGHGSAANQAITCALQLVYQNELLTGEVVKSEELSGRCPPDLSSHRLCLFVHWDGRIEALSP